jgi:hypothetical protein
MCFKARCLRANVQLSIIEVIDSKNEPGISYYFGKRSVLRIQGFIRSDGFGFIW